MQSRLLHLVDAIAYVTCSLAVVKVKGTYYLLRNVLAYVNKDFCVVIKSPEKC